MSFSIPPAYNMHYFSPFFLIPIFPDPPFLLVYFLHFPPQNPLPKLSQREKEETEFKVPEILTLLCVKATRILLHMPRSNHKNIKPAPIRSPKRPSLASLVVTDDRMSEPVKSPKSIQQVNRCTSCHKRVGLIEFRCPCGDLFCGEHRYSDPHVCGYDYKGVIREAITRANPVVKASKIVKISNENLVLAVSFSINFKLVFLRNLSLIISLQMDVTSDGGDRQRESHHTVFTNAKAVPTEQLAEPIVDPIDQPSEDLYTQTGYTGGTRNFRGMNSFHSTGLQVG